jgi:hypothetical protein
MSLDRLIYQHAAGIAPDIHLGRAPSPAPELPYVVMDPLAGTVLEYDSAHVGTEELRLRFHVWGTDRDRVRTMMLALESGFVFHEGDLSDADTKVLSVTKGADELMLDPDRDAEGDELWHGVIDLLLLVARNPGS